MKKLIIIFLCILISYSTSAQSDSCTILLEKISGNYTGQCLNGLADGKGTSVGEDIYIGYFETGLPHGKGKYIYKNGDVFQGYFTEGKRDGKGKFIYSVNGKKNILTGYWKNDNYLGVNNPDLFYRISSASGLIDYKIKDQTTNGIYDHGITLSIKSAFTDFFPSDLRVDISSGKLSQTGKKIHIHEYFCPLHCEISYSIRVGELRRQCRFIVDFLEEGKYSITLSND